MILTHKTGVLLHGTLAKDPVLKDVGQKRVLKFDVKAHSVKTDTGSSRAGSTMARPITMWMPTTFSPAAW